MSGFLLLIISISSTHSPPLPSRTALSRTEQMSPYVLAAAAAAAVLVVFLYYAVKNRRSSKLPPSPTSLPLIGHLHLMGRLPHRSLRDLHLRYGSGGGLLLLQLGRRRVLVVSTAAAAADIFKNHDLAFASRPGGAATAKLTYGCRNVSFAPYGEHWRRAKKVAVVHLLSPRRVESFAPVRDAEVAALVARVGRAAEAGEAVDLRALLYGYTNAVVTRATTGAAGPTAERLKQLMGGSEELLTGFQADDLLPDVAARLVRCVTGVEKRLDDMAEAWDRFFSEIMATHTEKGTDKEQEEEAEDFLKILLRLRGEGAEAEGFQFTDDSIKAIVRDMIAAATETSSTTMEWTMAELMANPRVMAKLKDEIERVINQPTVTQADLNKMEYLRAVLKEVFRLHPPAPLLVPHESTAPAVVQGYEVPAKTSLFINVWAIGRDPTAWDAPEEFWPERFVGGAVDFRGNDYQLIPFGAGRRICPGINFALPVVELALASLLHRFEWSLPDGMRPADLDMEEAPGLTTPRRVPLVLVPRAKLA